MPQPDLEISQLGMGAVVVRGPDRALFVDCFTRYARDVAVRDGDVLLFTHADHDHFDPDRAAEKLRGNGNPVFGPPSIALPLVRRGVAPERIQVVYPFHLRHPEPLAANGWTGKVYNTRHFNDWNPDHVSYLLRRDGRTIYLTGDSHELPLDDPDLRGCDLVVYSLVGKPRDRVESVREYLDQLEEVRARLGASRMLANHLIACDFTIRAEDLKRAAAERRLTRIAVLLSPDETLAI